MPHTAKDISRKTECITPSTTPLPPLAIRVGSSPSRLSAVIGGAVEKE